MVSLLERVSVRQAMRLAYGHLITVTTKEGDLFQYHLLRYSGFSRELGRHSFLVRLLDGGLATRTDMQLGLAGEHAIARLGEPERLATDDVVPLSA